MLKGRVFFKDILYLDTSLLAEETADLTKRTERRNNSADLAKGKELKRRENGKGRLSDEELKELEPLTIKDVFPLLPLYPQ